LKLLIIGAGGHGQVVKEIAEAIGEYEAIDFVDDKSENVVGKVSDIEKFHSEYDSAFVGIGNNIHREKLITELEHIGYTIPVLIHPTAYVSKSAKISKGTVIEPKAVVNANAKIGIGCIISVGTIIDHDVVIGDYVHANSGSIVCDARSVDKGIKIDAGEIISNKTV